MKLWLEFTPEEGEKLFEFIKKFPLDTMEPSVMTVADSKPLEDEINPENEAVEDKPKITIETIRAVLTEKKLQGKSIKGLFSKFGASHLSKVKEEDYPALLKEAEAI